MTARDRGHVEEIIMHLKRVENDYKINLTSEMEWLRGLCDRETIEGKVTAIWTKASTPIYVSAQIYVDSIKNVEEGEIIKMELLK